MSSDTDAEDPNAHDLTPDLIDAADRLAGREPASDEHRGLMLPLLVSRRAGLAALRASDLAEGNEPGLLFSPLLPGVAAPESGTENVAHLGDTPAPPYDGDPRSLAFATAADQARLLRAGEVTSRQLTEMYLARLKEFGPTLNCVVNLVPDEAALARADAMDVEAAAGTWRGPLHGVPCGVKDLFATRDLPTTYGARPYEGQMLGYDAAVVERLEAAGCVLLTKLSMGELALGDVWFGGKTRNPWRPEDGSSGSSAGSGAAVAAGLVGFAVGTETWGSIVSPSVVCGVFGLRPTFGRVSRYGAMPLSWSMDKAGPMCRSAEDCALVFAALHGADARDATTLPAADFPFRWDPGADVSVLRIGLDVAALNKLREDEKHAEKVPAVEAALAALEGLLGGAPLTPVELPEMTPEYETLPMLTIGVEGASSFAKLTAAGGLDELVQQGEWNWPNLFRTAAHVPATEYIQAQRVRAGLQRRIARVFEAVDLYITVPPLGPSLAYTNLTGHPEAVFRCGETADGMPVSLSVVGALYREDAVLALAHAFGRATGWANRWPATPEEAGG